MPYGIDPWIDIERLSGSSGLDVTTIFDVGANVGQTARTLSAVSSSNYFFLRARRVNV